MTTLDGNDLDRMVESARKLVKRPKEQVPDRTAVRNLLEFSRMTPSLEELLLFIEYQGARARRDQQSFYSAAAQQTQQLAGGDIDRARRFLALLARATVIASVGNGGAGADRRPGPSSPQGGRQAGGPK